MTTRGTKLNRLAIGSECKTSWDGMERDGCRRFCAECQRPVFDLALMTPAEIRAHVEASRGNLCGRITRVSGQLVTATPVAPAEPEPSWIRRRVSAVAAGVVTAWLGATAVDAQPRQAAPAAVGAQPDDVSGEPRTEPARRTVVTPRSALHGRVALDDGSPLAGVVVVAHNALDGKEHEVRTAADGTFRFAALAAGVYDLVGSLDHYWIPPQQSVVLQSGEERQADLAATALANVPMGGAMAVSAEPLRLAYRESDLVAVTTFGDSVETSRDRDVHYIDTGLQIESLIKGKVRGRTVTLRHAEYSPEDEGGWRAEFTPGTRALVFLDAVEDSGRAGAIFQSSDYSFGIRRLGEAEMAAYVDRIEALDRLERAAEARGESDPADITEWLVATAEDRLTRSEATGDLETAVEALGEIAAKNDTSADLAAADLQVLVDRFRGDGGLLSEDPPPELLAAYFTTAQRKRLLAALEATTSRENDFGLFMIVRSWDEKAALAWLVQQLGKEPDADVEAAGSTLWWLEWKLEDERLTALADAARDRLNEIRELWPEDESEAAAKRREEMNAAVYRDLRHDFAATLAAQN